VVLYETFLILPIHRRTQDRYSKDERSYIARRKTEWAKRDPPLRWRPGFDVDAHLSWGSWLLNDVVGWLQLGWDGIDRLVGYLYLRAKFLPKTVRRQVQAPTSEDSGWRDIRNPELPEEYSHRGHHWVSWSLRELGPFRVDIADNSDCARVARKLVEAGQEEIRELNPSSLRNAVVWTPPYGLECINWVEAMRQARGTR
jgi:hypothetical protein